MTKKEIEETQMLVTTPEKWDVLTRKRSQDVELMSKIKLLILDEIHLLQDTRGAVIEALVARTLRMVNTSQVKINPQNNLENGVLQMPKICLSC